MNNTKQILVSKCSDGVYCAVTADDATIGVLDVMVMRGGYIVIRNCNVFTIDPTTWKQTVTALVLAMYDDNRALLEDGCHVRIQHSNSPMSDELTAEWFCGLGIGLLDYDHPYVANPTADKALSDLLCN